MKQTPETLRLQLKKWQLKNKCKPNRFYFIYFVVIICLAYIVDEVTANVAPIMQHEIINNLFNNDSSRYVLVTSLCSGIAVLSFLYKTLSDKYGRKPFLVINLFGMAASMVVCFASRNWIFFSAGLMLMYFFTPCDIQVLYVLETSGDKHRGFWMSFTKSIGIIGVSFVSMLRPWALSRGWNYIFLFPAAIGLVVGVICLLFIDESDVFVQNKIKYLKHEIKKLEYPDEVENEDEKIKNRQGGIISAIRYMLLDKSLIWLFVVGLIFSLATIATGNYSLIMQPAVQSVFSDDMVSQALTMYPFAYALIEVLIGMLSDKIGRIKAVTVSASVTLIAFLCFVIGCKDPWDPFLVGLFLGLFIGGYYVSIDLFNVICAEKSPTNLRSSILSVINVSFSAGSFIATGIFLLISKVMNDVDVGYMALIMIIPSMFVSLLLLITKMPETKSILMKRKKKSSK